MPGASTTYASTTSPRMSSGWPTTATSITDGCSTNTLSMSNGPMRYPAMMMTSSSRELKKKLPSASRWPVSPGRYQRPSSVYRDAVFSGASRYPANQ